MDIISGLSNIVDNIPEYVRKFNPTLRKCKINFIDIIKFRFSYTQKDTTKQKVASHINFYNLQKLRFLAPFLKVFSVINIQEI